MKLMTANSVRLHYVDEGPSEAPALVFANSLGTDVRVWDALLDHLPAGFRTIRYDLRGHGLSDAPEGEYRMADLVGDAAGLMDRLDLRDAVFVGLSIGGVVAQGLAAARPDLVRALVLCNTAARIGTAESWRERIEAVRSRGIAAIADALLERWFSPEFRAAQPDELVGWRHMLTRTPASGYMACCAALAGADLRASTASLTLPTLAVAGSVDGSTPPDLVRATAATIAGARFEVIDGVGHIPCVEAPERLARLIGGFLEEQAIV